MPPELAEMLRAWIASIAREAAIKALAEATSHARDEYMTTREAARFARVTTRTVRRWVDDGRLTRHGARYLRISRVELERQLQAAPRRKPLQPLRTRRRELTPEEHAAVALGIA